MNQGAKRGRKRAPEQGGRLKRAAHDEVAVAQNNPEEPNVFTRLSFDVFAILLSFMSLVDVARFATASKGIHTRMSTDKANALWLKYIQALHEIDASVPLPTKAQFGEQGYFQTVMEQAKAIHQRQLKDLAYLKERHPAYLDELNAVDLTMGMKGLKARQALLERINSELIRPRIHLDNTELELRNIGITCIPESLFAEEEFADYWQRLTVLNCGVNELHTLPESIGKCAALKELACSSNQLVTLPDSLGNCAALQKIWCSNNQLRTLPESIGKCAALQILICNNNQLRTLPESLGNSRALLSLLCKNNQLRTLPSSLGNCAALLMLNCNSNQLREIPQSLQNRKGSGWSKDVLATQTPSEVEQAPAMLTQYNDGLQRGLNNKDESKKSGKSQTKPGSKEKSSTNKPSSLSFTDKQLVASVFGGRWKV